MNRNMRAVEITSFGGPEVLRLGERPVPQAGAGELLIRVAASGINRPDVLQRMGHYAPPPGTSDLPGLEVAGVVESGDAAAMAEAGIRVGDRVCALVAGGGYAQWCVAPVVQCLPVPDGFSDVEAASLPETLFTACGVLFVRLGSCRGGVEVVHGGSVGVGGGVSGGGGGWVAGGGGPVLSSLRCRVASRATSMRVWCCAAG